MKRIAILFLLISGSLVNGQETGMWDSGSVGGPVSFGIPSGSDIYFSQGTKLHKGIEGAENIEVVSSSSLLEAATQIKINGDNLFAIHGLDADYKNNITRTTLSNPSSLSSSQFSGISNGINKFAEIDGFVLLAHNKDGVLSDKLVGEDLLGSSNSSFNYIKDFKDFTINGYIAYLIVDDRTTDRTIEILDFSAKSSAQKVGSILVKQAQSVYYSNGYLYVACENGEGLKIIDVSTPSSPVLTGAYDANSFTQVIVDGTIAYLRKNNLLTVLDVSDSANPTYVNVKTLDDISASVKFTDVANDKIYYVDNGVFGIIDANTLNISQKYLSALTSDWVASDNTTLVVYDKASYYFHSLEDPYNPKAYAVLAAEFEPIDFVISGTDFYVTTKSKLYIHNTENLSTPSTEFTYFGEFSAFKIANNFAVVGEYKYEGSVKYYYFEIIDLSDKSNPTQLHLAEYPVVGTITSIEISPDNNTLYLASELNGKVWLTVFDITNKTAPVRMHTGEIAEINSGKDTKLGIDGTELFVVTNYLTLNNYYAAKIFAYSVEESSNPRLISGLQITESEYNNVTFLEELLFVTIPSDSAIRMYSLDGDSTFRKEWTQIKTLDLDEEPANMAVFVNKTIPASSPKGIREIAGDYRTGTLYKSKKKKGTEIIYLKLKPEVIPKPKVKVQLTTSILPAEAAAGGCTVSPSGGEYDKNASASISANAASGWVFDNWSGDLTGSANPSSLTMSSDKNVIGNFKPVLELNFNSVDAQNIKVPKNDEKIHIGSAYLTAGGVDWEFQGITFTALEKIKPINARAFINYDGNTKEGTFSLDSEGYISEINFALSKIIPEDYTLIVSFYYMFDFPLNEKDLLAPLDEIKKLGISFNKSQVACDPVISVQGVKVPADNFTSNYQTMGWIWNASLTPHKPFVTFQEAIDDSETKDGDTIEVWKGYYKYASAINISKPLSFIADDGATNTLIEVENTLPTKGSVTSSATNVSFDGFTILGNDEDFGVLSTSTITIKNSTIRDCGKAAVFLNGDGILTINNCKIWSNAGDGLAFGSSDWENKNYYLIIEGNGTEIISNTGNGIKSFGGDIRIFGTNNKVYGNSEWGIKSMSGDIYINDDAIASIHENGKGGIITPNDARIPKGFIIENNDGPGLVVLGASSLILEDIKIKNNKGDAIGFGVPSWPTGTTDLLIRGTENVITNNEGNGIYITSGDLVIEGTNTKIDGNTGWGIKSMKGSIAIEENAMTYISNNSKGGIICAGEGDVTIPQNFTIENNGGPGLVSMGATKPLNLKNIKIKNNGGDGIGFQMYSLDDSDTSPQLIIYGANNEIINNKGNGIISFGANILISGSGTQIHDNTGWGIRSNQGGITINNGSMQSVNSNGKGGIACLSEGKLELPSNFIIENNSGPGIIIYDEKPVSFWSIKVKNNLGHGLISMSKDLYIWGGSEFINNTGNGIYSRFSGNVTISGKDIDISDNHNWGVVVENGNGNIDGTSQSRVKLNNNLDGGVWIQNGKLKSRNINVLSNLGDGIRCAKKIFVGQAKICSNTGKGIVSGGTTTLEQVNICENKVTGVYVTPTISYADLAVEISGTEGPINVNENIIYNITVTNNGPDLAHGVMMNNPLPVGLSFVKVSSSNGESYEQDGTVYCDIGALTNGGSINIELTTSASNGGTFLNSASIESGMIDNDKNNNIASITTIVTSPLTPFLSGYETDKQSKFIKKNYPQESSTHLSYISNYIINYPTAYSPIEDDEYSQSKISGSIIEGNKNGGILYNSESEIVVDNSNIIGNSPYGLKNNISTATITATNNYWGNSAGPSIGSGISNGVIGNVNISDWLNSRVALTVAAEIDTVLITKNMVDTVFCFFQNWDNINDVVKVDITESENWISNSTSFSINLHNGSASSPIIINTPVDATSSELNKVFITGISQTNSNDTQIDSFVVKVYKPVSTTISIIPDSIVIGKGDTLQFSGTVKDQFGNFLEPNLKWEASSSTISDSGLFIADSTEGVVEITAIDLTTSLKAKTSILINSNKRVLSGITISPDSLIIMPNHDFIFKANGFDKDGFSINFEAVWTTDGGVIDSLGHFVADESLGYFTVEVSDTSGNIKGYSYIEIALLTNVEKENVIPKQYSLNQNYPNPFNPSTTISYALPYDSKVSVEIFNVLGQRVGVIASGVESAGLHSTLWDAGHLASGIYIIRINATSVSSDANFVKSIKMLLLK